MAIRLIRREKVQKLIDHALTANRDLPDQHPMVAITGLNDYLNNMSKEITDISNSISDKIVVGGNENLPVEIELADWFLDTSTGEYSYIVNHELKTENVIVEFYNSSKRHIELEYEIIDQDSFVVYTSTPLYTKLIINASLGMLTDSLRTIKTSDFIDDTGIRSNKTWSSFKISNTLLDYAKSANVYTRVQATQLFASKTLEHTHTNKPTLDLLDEDADGNLMFNGVRVTNNVEPIAKVLTWDQENATIDRILDTQTVYADIHGIFITGSEFIIQNKVAPVDETTDLANVLLLKVLDGGMTILDTTIRPGETQKYLLGTSPNVQVFVQGIFKAQYTVEALSQIGNMTLNPNVVQDANIGLDTTWSSIKIQNEFTNKARARLQDLDDITISTKKDNVILAYSMLTDKFVTVEPGSLTANSGYAYNQANLIACKGTVDDPVTVEIPINTTDFKVPKINVLKFSPRQDNIIKNENTFLLEDKTKFIADDYVLFDDGMELKTTFSFTPVSTKILDSGMLYSYDIGSYDLKNVDESYLDSNYIADAKLVLNATPNDRLVVQKNNFDLSFAQHIDYFKLIGTGTNIRVALTVDEGTTWKTFNTDHWENVDLTVTSIKANGMSIDTFNNIDSTHWDDLVNNKIRFAYVLSMDNLGDKEELTGLQVQYDSYGIWTQAKDSEYDVMYVSNTLAKVLLYISGDMKINY